MHKGGVCISIARTPADRQALADLGIASIQPREPIIAYDRSNIA